MHKELKYVQQNLLNWDVFRFKMNTYKYLETPKTTHFYDPVNTSYFTLVYIIYLLSSSRVHFQFLVYLFSFSNPEYYERNIIFKHPIAFIGRSR